MKKIFCIIAGSLFLLIGFRAVAESYVLQGAHVLELMIRNTGKAKRLQVTQRLVIYENAAEQSIRETVRYAFPDHFRSDIASESTQRIFVSAQGSALTVIDGKAAPGRESRFDRYKDILLYQSRTLLTARLTLLGIDVTVSSLGRFQDRIVYIIGGEYPDETRSQVWVDKETFRPLRWILKDDTADGGGGVLEFRYQNWRKIDSMVYPMKIEFIEGGKRVREIAVETLDADPVFPEQLFNIAYLQSQYLPAETGPAPGGIGEVQKAIEEFKRRYE